MPVGSQAWLLALPAVLVVYTRLGPRAQTWLVAGLGAFVLALWDVRFVLVAFVTTAASFAVVQRLDWERPEASRRRWFWLGVFIDVSVLVAFRVLVALTHGCVVCGLRLPVPSMALPLGISFYTLARLTHLIEVYSRLERPTRSFLDLFAFTTFFPVLACGPIERASRMLPLFAERRHVTLAGVYEGAQLILLGVFEKTVIADHAAALENELERGRNGALLALFGVVTYALQIFADFSGYSDIARGLARCFGVEVTVNFRAPYAATSITDYWRRWHISLSTWLEDFVYRPTGMALRHLGGAALVGATCVTFFVSALWHGTGVTFLIWGAIHAAGVSVHLHSRSLRKRLTALAPRTWRVVATLLTFTTVCFGYVFFRAPNVASAVVTLRELTHLSPWRPPKTDDLLEFGALAIAVVGLHELQRKAVRPSLLAWPAWTRATCYAGMLFLITRLPGAAQRFIYLQF